ncbi:MAG: Inositol polyphosphate 5-phosphatase K [Paramarteilia canceri]
MSDEAPESLVERISQIKADDERQFPAQDSIIDSPTEKIRFVVSDSDNEREPKDNFDIRSDSIFSNNNSANSNNEIFDFVYESSRFLDFDSHREDLKNQFNESASTDSHFSNFNYKEYNVNVCTFNVAECSPYDNGSLRNTISQFNSLFSNLSCSLNSHNELIVIVLQEVDMSAQYLAFDSFNYGSSYKIDQWKQYFEVAFKSKIVETSVCGSLMMIFVYDKLLKLAKENFDFQTMRLGIAGMAGNKSAIGLHIEILGSYICIIGCHLSAHEQNLYNRMEEINRIEKNMNFTSNKIPLSEHDSVIFLGDMNFRCVGNPKEIFELIDSKKYKELAKMDQLKQNWQGIFPDYNEPELNFPPTYKFFKNSTY